MAKGTIDRSDPWNETDICVILLPIDQAGEISIGDVIGDKKKKNAGTQGS